VDTIGRQVTAFVTMFMLAGLIILMYMIFEPQRQAAAYNEQIETASQRGAKLFAANCVVCHTVTGAGIPGAGFPLNTDDNKAPDDDRRTFLMNTIYNGRQNSNGWNPNMPAFYEGNGGPLNSQQVDDIITFIGCGNWDEVAQIISGELGTPLNAIPTPPSFKTPNARILPGAPDTATPAAGAAAAQDPGAAIFGANCITCHKITPEFPSGAGVGPNLTGVGARKIPSRSPIIPNQLDIPNLGPTGLATWIRNPSAIRSGTGMPAFGPDKISDADLKALTEWLFKHQTPAATTAAKSCFKTLSR
jgi:mono/diheme cytochrome c family protein